ncbi:MAG TPA: hypothetical protein VGV59_17990 [Pyrinomonadaceae bacterium]|nr:hypothetical protein [Pyrinomonadaceae bacterium]
MRERRKASLRWLLAVIFSLTVMLAANGKPENEMGEAKAAGDAAENRVATGLWGGERVSLEVGDEGARVEYDCAHGTIDRPLVLDRRGRFNVTGTHVEERGGPVRMGEGQNAYAVRFSGQVSGARMKLTVRRSDNKASSELLHSCAAVNRLSSSAVDHQSARARKPFLKDSSPGLATSLDTIVLSTP